MPAPSSAQAQGGGHQPALQPGLPAAKVVNAGQPGYTRVRAARFLGAIDTYPPDLAVIFLPMGDHNLVRVSDLEHLCGGLFPWPPSPPSWPARSRPPSPRSPTLSGSRP
jgi:hypothetical protein